MCNELLTLVQINTNHSKINYQQKKMMQKELSELTDQELLEEAKKMKSTSVINAALIGFLIGIVIYSVVKDSVGFFTLIPLFIVYKLVNHSKDYDALKKILKERNLK